VAIAAQLMQILSQPAAEAADAVAGSGPIAPCTAGECAQCGRHEPLTQGTVVTQT
jgi:hypothetical protein